MKYSDPNEMWKRATYNRHDEEPLNGGCLQVYFCLLIMIATLIVCFIFNC